MNLEEITTLVGAIVIGAGAICGVAVTLVLIIRIALQLLAKAAGNARYVPLATNARRFNRARMASMATYSKAIFMARFGGFAFFATVDEVGDRKAVNDRANRFLEIIQDDAPKIRRNFGPDKEESK